jgi:hypothetical protein
MTEARAVHAAEERLLDAALVQVLARPRHGVAPAAGATPWLAAALVLLGVLVTATTMWLGRAPAPAVVQEPAPLPVHEVVRGRSEIEALPADTQHIAAYIMRPADVALFERFRSLRKVDLIPLDVRFGPIETGRILPVWSAPPADLLTPLTRLPALECVRVTSRIVVSPALLAPLAASRSITELHFEGEHVRVDDAFVQALAAIPNLRALRFDLVRLDAAVIDRLRLLKLTSLELSRPNGFDATAWQALCATPSLEKVALEWLGRPDFFGGNGKQPYWMPQPEDLRALGKLSKLRRVELHRSMVTDEHLESLPTSLTDLALDGHELTPDGFRSLKRFTDLRSLRVATRRYNLTVFATEPADLRRASADALADAIGALRLRSLNFEGEFSDELARAVAAQPDLADVYITTSHLGDLSPLANAPALRRLRVDLTSPGPTLDSLAPLRHCRHLESLTVWGSARRTPDRRRRRR